MTLYIPEFKDEDGVDEWNLSIFDVSNPSEALHEFQGTFRACVMECVLWQAIRALESKGFKQLRVVIERVC